MLEEVEVSSGTAVAEGVHAYDLLFCFESPFAGLPGKVGLLVFFSPPGLELGAFVLGLNFFVGPVFGFFFGARA